MPDEIDTGALMDARRMYSEAADLCRQAEARLRAGGWNETADMIPQIIPGLSHFVSEHGLLARMQRGEG